MSSDATHAHDEHHPTDGLYWKIGAILGVITLAEVSTYFITDDPYTYDLKPFLIGGLFVMMIAKFAVIGAYFMHLKFDSVLLRTVFIAGLVLAAAVYFAMMGASQFFAQNYEQGLSPLLG